MTLTDLATACAEQVGLFTEQAQFGQTVTAVRDGHELPHLHPGVAEHAHDELVADRDTGYPGGVFAARIFRLRCRSMRLTRLLPVPVALLLAVGPVAPVPVQAFGIVATPYILLGQELGEATPFPCGAAPGLLDRFAGWVLPPTTQAPPTQLRWFFAF